MIHIPGVNSFSGALVQRLVLSHSEGIHESPTDALVEIIRQVKTRVRKVSITYDDLWNEYNTRRICRAYYRRDIRLTLFPVGRAVNNNLSLEQLIDEEFKPAIAVMRRALGSDFWPVGIRPPYGRITKALHELCKRYHLPLIMWGLDSQDAICTRKEGAENCEAKILSNYESYLRPGTIILHHAIKASYLAIGPTLELLSNWNMEPIPLSELLTYASRPEADSG